MPIDHPDDGHKIQVISRRQEILAFVVLAILIWPVLAVGVVGGYGFLVWMYQLIAGPPGPPG
jgi:nitrate reductase NapE